MDLDVDDDEGEDEADDGDEDRRRINEELDNHSKKGTRGAESYVSSL